MAYVQAVVQACVRQGLNPGKLLLQAQITPEHLSHAQRRVTADQFEALSAAAMQALDDEALGWFSRPLPWGSYGMLARASLSAPTLGVALKRWCRHHGLLTRDIALALHTQGDEASIALTEHRPPGGDGSLREFCHVSVLRNIHGLACWLIDSRIPLRGARFAFGAPAHTDVYRVLFDGPSLLRPGPERHPLRRPLPGAAHQARRAAMNQMLQRALPLQVRPYRRDRLLVQRVRQLLLAEPQHTRNADDLARCSTPRRAACTGNCRRKAPRCSGSRTRCGANAPWTCCSAPHGRSSRSPKRRASRTRKASSAPSRAGPARPRGNGANGGECKGDCWTDPHSPGQRRRQLVHVPQHPRHRQPSKARPCPAGQ
jgi:hypothetical protein